MTTEVANQVAEHPLMSPSVESQPEKKPVHTPRSQGDSEPRKELVNSGTLNFEPVQEKVKAPKPQSPGTYRFGRLSHHSFFSRHHPHPQRVTHIQDLTGKPVCVVRDIGDQYSLTPSPQDPLWSRCLMKTPTIATPIGDPQSNQEPQLPSEAWKKELKTLASRIAVFTKENEPKDSEKEEPQREEGAKYSAETGRLIPASAQAFGRRHSRQGHRSSSSSSSRNGDIQTILKDQELLDDLTLPGVRFSGSVGRGHRAGLQGLHLPPRVPTSASSRHSYHHQPCVKTPHRSPKIEMDHSFLDWRVEGGTSPEVEETPKAEEAAGSQVDTPFTMDESQAELSAGPAHFSPQPVFWENITFFITSPDPGSSRVGRPTGSLKHSHQELRDSEPGLGTPLSDSSDRLFEIYPVLATLRSPEGEGPGIGTPPDSSGSASSSAPSLYPRRETPEPAPGSPGISRETTAHTLQSIPEEDEDISSTQKRETRVHWKSTSSSDVFQPEHRRKNSKDNGRALKSEDSPTLLTQTSSHTLELSLSPQPKYLFCYSKKSIKL
ncbi:protein TBATA isoform X2 [Erinaceus europaeus]|uniref:Protein TBATA isoform X2 n=1 Tax=Erinaceus europaeus TaxID=9365 RepID=A0ABM3Y6D3_ERIEU|nr:protein TBATA isoform X2 [Erinaceus europaeus]XP_060056632.1 protein TBATA isoform X2 [Erinaceus europaeus]